jgi:predicted RNase H-like nuclease (RuvC/YqgF family)
MEFLKQVLGDDLFAQLKGKVDEWNADEKNKDKNVKLANLAGGEYVSKGKFDSLGEQLTGKQSEIDAANKLIEELKKSTKGNEDLQTKITGYETQVEELQKQLADTKLKSAVKVALLEEHAVDIDYLTYKLQEKMKDKGESLELDENDKIKGWNTQLEGLKTQFPTMFVAGTQKITENKLPQGGQPTGNEPKTLEEALKFKYEGGDE